MPSKDVNFLLPLIRAASGTPGPPGADGDDGDDGADGAPGADGADAFLTGTPTVYLLQELEYTFTGRTGTTNPLTFNPTDGRTYTGVAGHLLELNYGAKTVADIANTGFDGSEINPSAVSNEGHVYVGGTGAGAAKTLFKVDGGSHAVTDLTSVFGVSNQARFLTNVPTLGHIFMLRNGSTSVDVINTSNDTSVTTGLDLEGATRPAQGVWYVEDLDVILIAYGSNGDGKTKLHIVNPASQASMGNVLISNGGGSWVWNSAWDDTRQILWLADGTDFWEINLTVPGTPVATKRTVGSLNMGGNSAGNPVACVPATEYPYFYDNGFWDRLAVFDYTNNMVVKQMTPLSSQNTVASTDWVRLGYNPFDRGLYALATGGYIVVSRIVP